MYASLDPALDFQTLPVDAEVVVPSGTALYVMPEPGGTDPPGLRRVVSQDTFTIPLAEPVDVVFAEELEEAEKDAELPPPAPIQLIAPMTEKSDDDTPWYKTPAFIGGVMSVLVFTGIAYLQSRAESKLK